MTKDLRISSAVVDHIQKIAVNKREKGIVAIKPMHANSTPQRRL